jgi:hypothetical protein
MVMVIIVLVMVIIVLVMEGLTVITFDCRKAH